MVGALPYAGTRLSLLALVAVLSVTGCQAQESEPGHTPAEPLAADNPLPQPYGHVKGLLKIQIQGLVEEDAKAFLAGIGYEVLDVRLTSASVWAALDTPLEPAVLETLLGRPEVQSARHLKPPSGSDGVRLVVGCSLGMLVAECEQVVRDLDLDILKSVKLPQEYTIETPEGRERDTAWKLMQAHPDVVAGARYVVL